MAKPYIRWTLPLEVGSTTSSPGESPGDPAVVTNNYVSISDPHILRNDLVTVSRKAPTGLIDANGRDIGGTYFARFNDVDRVDVPFVPASPGGTDSEGNPVPATQEVAAHSLYTFTDRGHISLEGGVFELLPFSSGVSPATTVTFTDFAGTGRSEYPATYTTGTGNNLYPAAGPGDNGGVLLCGAVANVEVQHSYEIGPMVVAPSSDGTFGTAAIGASVSPGGTEGSPVVYPASITENPWTAYFGDTHGPAVPKFSVDTSATGAGSGVTNHGTETRISELYTVGGTLSFTSASSPAAVYTVHTGAIEFELIPDTEAIIAGGNISKTDTGTASWAAGQDRTMTVTTSSAHGLTDQYNRVYITGSSNNAMNGLWNVATVTGTTSFTVKLFAAQCGPSAITSSVNVVTYDGIDKKGGVLRRQTGTINTIQKVVILSPASGTGPSATPATHSINYRYIGPHGLGSSGTVTASVSGSGLASGTHGSNPIPAGDFTGSVTIDSGTQFTRSVASGLAGGSGTVSGTVTTLASGLNASTFNAGDDIEVVAGGMAGNNQVILKGMTTVDPSKSYSFHGNTTSSQVSVITFTGKTSLTSMFGKAGFKLNTTTGRVFTEGAPSSQPSGTDGMPGGFDPNTNPDGGVKEIDSWCPRYMHAKAKALERNDTQELLKANTSGQHDIDQLLASPIVDENSNITTFLTPRERFHETCWFNIRALKRRDHRRTNTFVENEDWIDRQFGINVYTNPSSDRNEIILDYIDQTNKTEVANTDTAFVIDGEPVTNEQHLNTGYANGNFTNQ